jgi:Protein of unknown function (DUF3551)
MATTVLFMGRQGSKGSKEMTMRKLIFATMLAVAGLGSSAASAQDYPYCLQGREYGYPGNCQFTSYAQCEATASGTFSYCGTNPRFYYQSPRGRRPWGW